MSERNYYKASSYTKIRYSYFFSCYCGCYGQWGGYYDRYKATILHEGVHALQSAFSGGIFSFKAYTSAMKHSSNYYFRWWEKEAFEYGSYRMIKKLFNGRTTLLDWP